MNKYEKILAIVKARTDRKQEPTEDFVSYNTKKKEAKLIYKAIVILPPTL